MSRARVTKKRAKLRSQNEELAELLARASVQAREAANALVETAVAIGKLGNILRKPTPGVCRFCGCTEQDACRGGCAWVDAARTRCSRCFASPELDRELGREAKADEKRARARRRKV